MADAPLTRKQLWASIPVYEALDVLRKEKALALAKKGKGREVTFDEVLRDKLGMK